MSTENPSRPDDAEDGVTGQTPSPTSPQESGATGTAADDALELPQAAPDFDGEAREEAAAADTVGMIGTFPLGRPAAREQSWDPEDTTSASPQEPTDDDVTGDGEEDGSGPAPAADGDDPEEAPVEASGQAPAGEAATSHARRSGSGDEDDVDSTAVRRRSLFAAEGTGSSGGSAPSGASPASAAGPAGTTADDAEASTAALPTTRTGRPVRSADPAADTSAGASAEESVWQPRAATRPVPAPAAPDEDAVLLEGSSVVGRPAPRTAAHWAGVLLAVVLFPFAWFLVHGGASYLTGGDATTWPTALSARGLGELVAGALTFTVAVLTARRSSLGAFVVGLLCLAVGLPFVVAPVAVGDAIGPFLERLQAHSALGADLAGYLMADGLTGRFVLLGLFMVALGVVSHSARRAGRREQEIVDRARRA